MERPHSQTPNSIMALYFPRNTLNTFCFLITFIIGPSHGRFAEDLSEAIKMKRTEKTSHLHFYFHDIHSGQNPSAIKIIEPKQGQGFGTTFMMDDPLTEEQEPTSKIIGRAQGLYSMADQNDIALLMVVSYEFIEGEFNGSSVSVLGRNPVMHDVREMPIVGGTGVFQLASGYALAHTVWADFKTGDAIIEYNMYVQHY